MEISVCSLNRVSACVPSVTGDDALPKERSGTYGTTAYGPPERNPQLGQGCVIFQVETGDQVIFGLWG
jgi:hypothetical protein